MPHESRSSERSLAAIIALNVLKDLVVVLLHTVAFVSILRRSTRIRRAYSLKELLGQEDMRLGLG